MISLTEFLVKFNNIIKDNIRGVTDANGAADGSSFIDSNLSSYSDFYFGDPERDTRWQAYIGTQLRIIKESHTDGVLIVHKPFSAQILANTAYEIHRYDRNDKINAINEALSKAYPWFYKKLEDESLVGTVSNEYALPAGFTDYPNQIWVKYVDGDDITYREVSSYFFKDNKFYASIPFGHSILLIGMTTLTPFGADDSVTELTDPQADVLCLLAASILFRKMSIVVSADDSGRFDSLSLRYEERWEREKLRKQMPFLLPNKINFGWLK